MGLGLMVRILVGLAGLAGGLGISLSALAAHFPGGASLGTAGTFLLIHGAAFLALAALNERNMVPSYGLRLVAMGWTLGLTLFCGDLAARIFLGWRLFPGAAPAGGIMLILAWLALAATALLPRR
jgi:uncharacterized membrane protein YgdD (TMEM256/DUF423 family)